MGRRHLKGKPALSLTKTGYIRVVFSRKEYSAARIIWTMFNGDIPKDKVIDHINRIRNDNRIENLRVVTQRQNVWNHNLYSTNTSGATGVYWSKRYKKWEASFKLGNKSIYGGRYHDFNEAVIARKKLENRIKEKAIMFQMA